MDSDLLWQIFSQSKRYHRAELCFLSETVYDCPELAKWRDVLVGMRNKNIPQKLTLFSDCAVLLWLRECDYLRDVIHDIFRYERENILYLLPQEKLSPHTYTLLYESATFGKLEPIKWILQEFNTPNHQCMSRPHYSLMYAIISGHIRIAKWLTEYYSFNLVDATDNCDHPFRWAANNGHLHMLKWMTEQFNIDKMEVLGFNKWALCLAAEAGHFSIVKWMFRRFKLRRSEVNAPDDSPFVSAVKGGHLDISQWLARKLCITLYSNADHVIIAFSIATGRGYLPIARWIYKEFRFNETPYYNLDRRDLDVQFIIRNGHLRVFKWFIKKYNLTKADILGNRICGFQYAFVRGHMQLLQWMTEHFKITKADIMPLSNVSVCERHPEVIKWLVEHFELEKSDFPGLTKETLRTVVQDADSELFHWAIERFDL